MNELHLQYSGIGFSKIKCMEINLNKFNEITYDCLICKIEVNYFDINEHIINHFQKSPIKCHVCRRTFFNTEMLIDHLINCQHKFIENNKENNNIKNNNTNRNNNKNITNKFICYYCKKEFMDPHERLKHVVKHVKCSIQVAETSNQKKIIEDISTALIMQCNEDSINNEIYSTDSCSFVGLDLDQTKEIADNSITKKCNICCQIFNQEHKLIEHILNHRNDILPITKQKKEKKNRNKQKRVKRKPDEFCMCHVCGILMTDPSNLKAHLNIHAGVKKYQCDICKKYFSHPCGLKGHMRTHSKEKPYVCTICGARFRYKGIHRLHTLRHSKVRPHRCTHCDKSFVTAKYLASHNLKHTGERPFQCDICGVYFRYRKNLVSHKFLHSGTKTFKCKYCHKYFAQSSGLYSHQKIHKRNQNNVL